MPDRDPCLWAGTLAWLFHVREQAAAAFVAAFMAFLRGRYQGTCLHKTLLDAMMCALIAWCIRDSLGALDIDNDFSEELFEYVVMVRQGLRHRFSAL